MEKLKEYFKAQAAAVLREVNGAIAFYYSVKVNDALESKAVEGIVSFWNEVKEGLQGSVENIDADFDFISPRIVVVDPPVTNPPDPAPPVKDPFTDFLVNEIAKAKANANNPAPPVDPPVVNPPDPAPPVV